MDYNIIREKVGDHDTEKIKANIVELLSTHGGPDLYMQLKNEIDVIIALGDSMDFTKKNRNDLIAEYIWLLIESKLYEEEKPKYDRNN